MADVAPAAPAPSGASLPPPDWDRPLDLDWYVAHTPAEFVVKGLSLNAVWDGAAALGRAVPDATRVVPFRDVPLRDVVSALVRVARESFPELPAREALRRVGSQQFGRLRENLVFRVLFAGLGAELSVGTAISFLPRAYRVASVHERVEVLVNESHRVVLRLADVWTFPDCFQVGILEGGLKSLGVTPRMGVVLTSPCSSEIEAAW